jgi:protein-S-isoprenylcysteine O-methyltransferase Ste14
VPSNKSIFFVSVQFLTLGLLVWLNGSDFTLLLGGFVLASLLIGLLAIWEMVKAGRSGGKSQLSVTPEVKDGAELVKTDVYRYIAHPMYASLMIFGFGVVLNSIDHDLEVLLSILGLYLILLVNLYFKARYEERLLTSRFPEYSDYLKARNRFIPFLF